MNFFSTASAADILALPISEKERNHRSRDRKGYHVYLSAFYFRYSEMNCDEKKEYLVEKRLMREEDMYESDADSTDTPIQPPNGLVMKAAGRTWQQMSAGAKNAWKERADKLNTQPRRCGKFNTIPHVLEQNNLRMSVMDSLTMDWRNTVSLFHRSMVVNKKKIIEKSQMAYTFGKERVVLQTQSYRSFHMNHLLKLTIFGNPLFCNLLPYEIPYRTKNQAILHIYSKKRISELLTFGGLDATELYKDGLKYVLCPKVNLRKGRRNIIGYVMDENENMLVIKVEGAATYIRVRRPQYDTEHGQFNYNNPNEAQALTSYSLSQLWPIRMKVNSSGLIAYIISVHTYSGGSDDLDYIVI